VRVYVACIPIRLMLGEKICSLGGAVDPILGAILLFVGLSLVYTYIGGVKAVIWTDAVQFTLFLAGGLFALCYIPARIEGGWSAAWSAASAAGKLEWFNPAFTFGAPFNLWMGLLGGTALVLSTHGAEQLIVQRVLSCRNVADGRKALILSAVVIFPLMLIFLLVGAMLWAFYQGHPFQMALPETRPGIKSSDFIFPVFLITEVPHLLKGFLIVAILAAAMSSISSAITALASVSTMDFLKPLSPHRSEEFFLRFSKASTVGWALVLILVAWLSRQVEFVLNAAFSLRGLTSGALLGSLIIALFIRRWGARATMAGMVVSVLVMNLLYWPPNTPALQAWWSRTVGVDVFWPWFTLIGTLITLSVAAIVARLRPSDRSSLAQ
jgi:SSS family solute:Na+ symporter